jgi:hypothetical protein
MVLPAVQAAGKGAVKTGLFERQEGDAEDGPGSGDQHGFAVLNTTAGDTLNVTVAVKAGEPETEYNVLVIVDGNSNAVGALTTDEDGNGNGHFKLDVSSSEGDTVGVQVVVENEGAAYASATEAVPLK